MPNYIYRQAASQDFPGMAKIRAQYSATEAHWVQRITGYYEGTVNPQKAERPRTIIVACHNEDIIGFVAGHLTTRFDCEGELEWIDVVTGHRRSGIATTLLRALAKWFTSNNAYKICVDPGNEEARKFYQKNGATALNDHWMYWENIGKL